MMRDLDVRRALRKYVECRHAAETDVRFVEELGVCQGTARVDLAVLNGSVHGYEIKSQRDTLTRLPSQAAIYSQALEFVTIVAADQHIARINAERLIPAWWGVCSATQDNEEVHLETVREAGPNPSLDPFALVQFLWRDEVLAILSEHKLANGMTGKSRRHLWDCLAESFTVDEIGHFVRTRLKQRQQSWLAVA